MHKQTIRIMSFQTLNVTNGGATILKRQLPFIRDRASFTRGLFFAYLPVRLPLDRLINIINHTKYRSYGLVKAPEAADSAAWHFS